MPSEASHRTGGQRSDATSPPADHPTGIDVIEEPMTPAADFR
jgi:hypothetical protein